MEKEAPKERKRLSIHVKEFIPKPPQSLVQKPKYEMNHETAAVNTLFELVHNLNVNHVFEFDFLRLKDYSNLDHIRDKFLPLRDINLPILDLKKYEDAYFFVMRSSAYDDIHKAMKYGIWTSTPENIKLLSDTYKKAMSEKRKVVLFFRVVSDNVFNGAAELTSDYIEEQQFDLWWNKIKWKGIFNLHWIYVKNIELNYLSQMEGDKKIYELIDGSSLSSDNGLLILGLFQHYDYKYQSSIFNFFSLFDQREDALIKTRTSIDFQFKLQKRENKRPSGIDQSTIPKRPSIVNPGIKRTSLTHSNPDQNPNNIKPDGQSVENSEVIAEKITSNNNSHQAKNDKFGFAGSSKKKKGGKAKGLHGHKGKSYQEVVYVKKEECLHEPSN